MRVLDLFAGAGGWECGADGLGLDILGIEIDADACATREAVGLRTLQADVSKLDPLDFGPIDGLIASPPCQDFSMAGRRKGITGSRGELVWEVLRWTEALRPSWVACEQVPPVLPIWRYFARTMRGWGYMTWTGCLLAADYGVPQTRLRAILMASLTEQPQPPAPTHARRPHPSLFGDPDLKPWVSMSAALGWGMTQRAYPTIAPGKVATGALGGPGGREIVQAERRTGGGLGWRRTRGRGMSERHSDRPDTPDTEPAPVITSKARSDRWVLDRRTNSKAARGGMAPTVPVEVDRPAPTLTQKVGGQWVLRNNNQGNACVRDVDESAGTLFFEVRTNNSTKGGTRDGLTRDADEPSRTLDSSASQWTKERPATTVQSTNRIGKPGHRDRAGGEQQFEDSIPITLEEASVLQSFPADYPWQGSKTARFTQVGNAIPPLLAGAILRSLTAHRSEGAIKKPKEAPQGLDL